MTATAFKDSQEAAMRRIVRSTIRTSDLTPGQKAVTLAMANHWFHHKSNGKGFIHPSRAGIAKKAGVTVKTVSRTFADLRAAEVLLPVSGINGGKAFATRYRLDLGAMMALCGGDWIDQFRAAAGLKSGKMSRYRDPKCPGKVGTKCPTVLNDVGLSPSQAGKSDE